MAFGAAVGTAFFIGVIRHETAAQVGLGFAASFLGSFLFVVFVGFWRLRRKQRNSLIRTAPLS